MATNQTYHHGALRDAALDGAVARLRSGEGGLPTVRELASQLGVTHRALYRHFADKSALKKAVANEGFAMLARSMTTEDPPRPKSAITGYVRFALAEPTLYRLMFEQDSIALLQDPQSRRVLTIVRDAFALADPAASETEIRDRVISAWGLAHGLFELWRVGALSVTDPERAGNYILRRLAAAELI